MGGLHKRSDLTGVNRYVRSERLGVWHVNEIVA